MAKALTQLAVKAAKPSSNRVEIPDAGCVGLYLVLQVSGVKSWAHRYRFDRVPCKHTLGRADGVSALTLAAARKAVADDRHLIEQGIDPRVEKRTVKAASKQLATLREADAVLGLSEQFLELYAKPRTRTRTYQQSQDVLRRLVQPAWRRRTVHEVRRRDVIALVDRSHAGTGHRWRTKECGCRRRPCRAGGTFAVADGLPESRSLQCPVERNRRRRDALAAAARARQERDRA